jgi:hypothetical protein
VPKKTAEKRKRTKRSSCLGGQTSEQENPLAKPLMQSKKLKSQSSVLSILKKTSSMKVVIRLIAGGKIAGENYAQPLQLVAVRLCFSTCNRSVCLVCSDEETILPEPHQKRPQSSPLPKAILKSSGASVVEGTIM